MGFIHALPTETTLRLWDLLLLHGAAALFAASLATLRAVASPLASAVPGDFEACYTLLKSPHRYTLDGDAFVRCLLPLLEALTPARLEELRSPQRTLVLQACYTPLATAPF